MGRRNEPTAGREVDAPAARRVDAPEPDGATRGPDGPLSDLHRAYGNRRIQQMVVQAKMWLGAVGDHHEREADRVAEQVVDEAGPASPRPRIGRVRGSEGVPVDPLVQQLVAATRGRGRPLPAGVRHPFEQKLDTDLGSVRVHTGATADGLNRQLRSSAFTTGRDVYFRHGEFDPATPDGQEVLAHELVHVVQQAGPAAPATALVQRGKRKRKTKTPGDKKTDEQSGDGDKSEEAGEPGMEVDVGVDLGGEGESEGSGEGSDDLPKRKVKRTRTTPTPTEKKKEKKKEKTTKKEVTRSATGSTSKGKGPAPQGMKRRRNRSASTGSGEQPDRKKARTIEVKTLSLEDMGELLGADIADVKEPEALSIGAVVWNINHLSRGGVDDDPEPSGAESKDAPFEVKAVLAELTKLGGLLGGAEKVLLETIESLNPTPTPTPAPTSTPATKGKPTGAKPKAPRKRKVVGQDTADPTPVVGPKKRRGVQKVPTPPTVVTPARPPSTLRPPTMPLSILEPPGPEAQAKAEARARARAKAQADAEAKAKAAARQQAGVRRELSQFSTDIHMLQIGDQQATLEPGLAALLAWRKDRQDQAPVTIEDRAERLHRIRALGRVWNRLDRLRIVFAGATRSDIKGAARTALRDVLRKHGVFDGITNMVDALLVLIPRDDIAIAISNLKKTAVRDLATGTFFTNPAINLVLINEMNLGMRVLSQGLPPGAALSKGPMMLAKARVTDQAAGAGAAAATAEGKKVVARQYESYPAVYRTEGPGGLGSKGTFYVTTSGAFVVQQGEDPQEFIPWNKSDEDKSFRGIVVHRLVQGKQELWAGVIHTTPAGTNLNRTDIWPQISAPLANLNSLAIRFKIPLLVGGDFYISGEGMVNKPTEKEKTQFGTDSPYLLGRVKATNVARNIYLEAERRGDAEVTKLINSMRPPFRQKHQPYVPEAAPADPLRRRSQSNARPLPARAGPARPPVTYRHPDLGYTWETYWSSVLDLVEGLSWRRKFPSDASKLLGPTLGYETSWKSTLAGGLISQDDIRRNQWRRGDDKDATKPGITLSRALAKLHYRIVEGGDPTNPKDRGSREDKVQLADLFIVNDYWKTALSGIVMPQSGQLKPLDDPEGTAASTYWKISDHSPAVMLGSTTKDDPELYRSYDLAHGTAARAALNNRYAWLTFEWRLREVLGKPLPDEPGSRDELSKHFDAIRALLRNPLVAPDPRLKEELVPLVKPLADLAREKVNKRLAKTNTDPATNLLVEMKGWTPYYPINVREEELMETVPNARRGPGFSRPPDAGHAGGAAPPPIAWPLGQIEHVDSSCYIAALIHVLASHDVYRNLLAPTPPVEGEPEGEGDGDGDRMSQVESESESESETKKSLRYLVDQLQKGATITRSEVKAFILHLDGLGKILLGEEASLVKSDVLMEAGKQAVIATATEDPTEMQQDAAAVLLSVLDHLELPEVEHVTTASVIEGSKEVFAAEKAIALKLTVDGPDNLVDALRANFIEIVEEEKETEGDKLVKVKEVTQRTKLTTFASLPDVLTIVVNRQAYDIEDNEPYKLDRDLKVPEVLEIPEDIMFGTLRAALKGEKVTYSLVSVVHHSGMTTRSGHYTSLARTADGGWYEHDDIGAWGRRSIPYAHEVERAMASGYIYTYSRDK